MGPWKSRNVQVCYRLLLNLERVINKGEVNLIPDSRLQNLGMSTFRMVYFELQSQENYL
jgi:hypothetical protein